MHAQRGQWRWQTGGGNPLHLLQAICRVFCFYSRFLKSAGGFEWKSDSCIGGVEVAVMNRRPLRAFGDVCSSRNSSWCCKLGCTLFSIGSMKDLYMLKDLCIFEGLSEGLFWNVIENRSP